MKALGFLLPFALAACATKTAVVEDAPKPAPKPPSEEAAEAHPDPLPAPDEDLGLLVPRNLTTMPDERDMRPTVDPAEGRSVIANPPSGD
ncbi:hypothetical protein HNR46_004037 [Haloferula luteola]|uniref:Lipoprotein n=1 Tax=Haloferula luteola TaxID=595692 RepID=A0A840V6X8_9BACT|nr:hypothetical protein [Haloferula luteola]MBB5353775.1 hypothetical protein [Haloferula luteola]